MSALPQCIVLKAKLGPNLKSVLDRQMGRRTFRIAKEEFASAIPMGTIRNRLRADLRRKSLPVIMHFSTFLKFLTLDTGDKIRQLESYSTPGGFDFYRTSRDGVLQFSAHGRTRKAVAQDIAKLAPQSAAGHNIEIFEKVADWLDKQSGTRITPSRGVWPSPQKCFSVHIEPEIGLEKAGQRRILAVYPRREPRLNRDKAGAGVVLLRRAYKGRGDEEFGILDAYGAKAYWAPTNVSEALLDREIATIDAELERIMG